MMKIMNSTCNFRAFGTSTLQPFQRRRRRRSSSVAVLALSLGSSWTSHGVDSFYLGPITAITTTTSLATGNRLVPFQQPRDSFATRRYASTVSSNQEDEGITNLPRIYTSASLSSQAIVQLDANQSNYLHVMRITNPKRWGALAGHVRLFNGKDGEWLAQLLVSDTTSSQNKRQRRSDSTGTVVACLEQYKIQPNPSPLQIHLHVACLKKTRLKWVLEKATELGVDTIHLVDTEYSTKEGGEQELYKHQTQIIEAAEQCERLTLPVLQQESWPILLQQMQQPQDDDESHHQWLVCRERSPTSSPLWSILQQQQFLSSSSLFTHVLVGPEGGWSPRELEQFQQIQEQQPSSLHFVSLGTQILRAETAAIVAISAVALANEVETSQSL